MKCEHSGDPNNLCPSCLRQALKTMSGQQADITFNGTVVGSAEVGEDGIIRGELISEGLKLALPDYDPIAGLSIAVAPETPERVYVMPEYITEDYDAEDLYPPKGTFSA